MWQCVKCGAELKLSETGTEFVDTSRDSLLSQRSGWESKLVEPVTFSNVMQKQMGLHSVSVTQSQDKAGNLVVVAPGGLATIMVMLMILVSVPEIIHVHA